MSVKSTREIKIAFDSSLSPVGFFDKNALFRGAVDLLVVLDGVLHICDYKTGKYKEERWQNYDQLLFYAVYFFNVYGKINTIKISYIYVEHELENEMTLTREHLEQYKTALFDKIKAVENDQKFTKNESKLCEWCPYKKHCSGDV